MLFSSLVTVALLPVCAVSSVLQTVDTMLPPVDEHIVDASFTDVRTVLYRNTSRVPLYRRNATVASIVWGAGNSHNSKTLQDAIALVDGVVTRCRNVDIVLFPETFLYNGTNAATINGSNVVAAMRAKAKQHSLYIVAPIMELLHDGQSQDGPKYNTAVLIDRSGAVRGAYRKHFPTLNEISSNVLPGVSLPVFDLDFGRIAILTCWDFNFPELWNAAAAQGADAVFWPAAAKGDENVQGHALNNNFFVVSNGAGQYYDRLGHDMGATMVNITASGADVLVSQQVLDMDSAVVFFGGPAAWQLKVRKFLADHAETITVAWMSTVSKMILLQSNRQGVSVRAALTDADIWTRQEQEAFSRFTINRLRLESMR